MKILVTGYKGFIGQNLTEYLDKNNIEWVGYEWGDEKYSLEGITRVIHLGAISSTTYSNVKQLLVQNYYFTIRLIEECQAKGIPIQISSSASVYGTDNVTFRETDTPAPKNHYAWSKYLVEEYCNQRYFNTSVQLFRYFNVYGKYEDHKGNQASPYHIFTRQALETGIIKLFEKSEYYKRDFVPVEDVCSFHHKFFNIKESGIWNIGTGVTTSFSDVAESIASKYNAKINTIPMPQTIANSYQKYTCANMSKTYNTLKYLGK